MKIWPVLFLFINALFLTAIAQDDDLTFKVRSGSIVTAAAELPVNIYWGTNAPEYDSILQRTIPGNLESMAAYGVSYRYRYPADTARSARRYVEAGIGSGLPYESMDVRIVHRGKATNFHLSNNYFSPAVTDAFRKTKPGDTVCIQLHRNGLSGEIRTEFLNYRIITFLKLLSIKRANSARIRKGQPLAI